jgi:hypothetical protein
MGRSAREREVRCSRFYSGSGFAFEPEEKILLFSLADVKRDFEREKTIV